MAEVEKHTTEAMLMIIKHNERQLANDSNTDIITERSQLNYSIPLEHGGLTDRQYFKKIVDESYLYGRGSSREADAITSFSWVITLPKSISDYTAIDKSEIGYLNPEAERTFFEGAVRFVSDRYGAENVIHNKIHFDEAGQPHIHIYVMPRKELDHDIVHFKTIKTKEAVQTDTGRWEFKVRFKLDADGERIPIKNYAKMSDYYDTKLSCKEILNTIELKHFHPEFASFLRQNHLPGAQDVHTGVTDGKNISVTTLKEFTKATGLTIDRVKELLVTRGELEQKISILEKSMEDMTLKLNSKDRLIYDLEKQISEKNHEIEGLKNRNEKEITVNDISFDRSSRWDTTRSNSNYDYSYDSGSSTTKKGGRW